MPHKHNPNSNYMRAKRERQKLYSALRLSLLQSANPYYDSLAGERVARKEVENDETQKLIFEKGEVLHDVRGYQSPSYKQVNEFILRELKEILLRVKQIRLTIKTNSVCDRCNPSNIIEIFQSNHVKVLICTKCGRLFVEANTPIKMVHGRSEP